MYDITYNFIKITRYTCVVFLLKLGETLARLNINCVNNTTL